MAYIETEARDYQPVILKMGFSPEGPDGEPDEGRNEQVFGHYADHYPLEDRITVRSDTLLTSCIDLLCQHYDMSRGDVVRRLLRIGLGELKGHFFEVTEPIAATAGSVRGEGAGSPFDSQSQPGVTVVSARPPAPGRKRPADHPHAEQNPEAA